MHVHKVIQRSVIQLLPGVATMPPETTETRLDIVINIYSASGKLETSVQLKSPNMYDIVRLCMSAYHAEMGTARR
eukprot:11994841-Heterocapsa_arctica.AAC.2